MAYENPTEKWEVRQDDDGMYRVYVPYGVKDGRVVDEWRLHTGKWNVEGFEDEDMAYETIDSIHQTYEEQYDAYLEENRHAIVQSELYEMHRREY
jgi:uncharacterized protein YegP (UPF0339 family)